MANRGIEARIQAGELVVLPPANRLMLVVSGINPTIPAREFLALLKDNPGMTLRLPHLAYRYPNLTDTHPSPITLSPQQASIRVGFPSTLVDLQEQKILNNLLAKTPDATRQQIQQNLDILLSAGVKTSVGELLLRELILAATKTVDLQTYPHVTAMHSLYGALTDSVLPSSSLDEDDHLRAIGPGAFKKTDTYRG